MGPPPKGSIRRPIAPWVNALTTELHLTPRGIKDSISIPRCHSFSTKLDISMSKRTEDHCINATGRLQAGLNQGGGAWQMGVCRASINRFRVCYTNTQDALTTNHRQADRDRKYQKIHPWPLLTCYHEGRSSEVERSLMVRWVVGSILHGVDPLSYFSFQQVLHDWYNNGHGMCYPLLLIDKSSLCGGMGILSHYQNGP